MFSVPLVRPESGTCSLEPETTDWQPTDTPGFWTKPLLDAARGGTTSLMRIDPGASAAAHSHDQLEEIFVISGEFRDQYRTYAPGHYCVRAVGEMHTATSDEGCVVLLVYRP